MDSSNKSEIGIEEIGQSDTQSTSSDPTPEPDDDSAIVADDLEIEFTVAGETFDTMDEAKAYVTEQKESATLDAVEDRLIDLWGEDAPDQLVANVSPDDEQMAFEDVARHLATKSELVPTLADTSPRVITGAILQEFGKQVAQNSYKFE